MRKSATLLLAIFTLATTPAWAGGLICPRPVILPATLYVGEKKANLLPVEAYLANLRTITTAYIEAYSAPMRNEITNCLMDHLVTLPDNHSLQQPQTRADGATWFMLKEEVIAALQTHAGFIENKPQLPFVMQWLATTPAYTGTSPYNLATR